MVEALTDKLLTEKFDVLRGRLLGNHNDFHYSLWLSLLQGFSDFFTCFFLSTTSEKLFIPYKPSATVLQR